MNVNLKICAFKFVVGKSLPVSLYSIFSREHEIQVCCRVGLIIITQLSNRGELKQYLYLQLV